MWGVRARPMGGTPACRSPASGFAAARRPRWRRRLVVWASRAPLRRMATGRRLGDEAWTMGWRRDRRGRPRHPSGASGSRMRPLRGRPVGGNLAGEVLRGRRPRRSGRRTWWRGRRRRRGSGTRRSRVWSVRGRLVDRRVGGKAWAARLQGWRGGRQQLHNSGVRGSGGRTLRRKAVGGSLADEVLRARRLRWCRGQRRRRRQRRLGADGRRVRLVGRKVGGRAWEASRRRCRRRGSGVREGEMWETAAGRGRVVGGREQVVGGCRRVRCGGWKRRLISVVEVRLALRGRRGAVSGCRVGG
jgi:hypothetical protein